MPASYRFNIRGTQQYKESFYDDSNTGKKRSLGFYWSYDHADLSVVDAEMRKFLGEEPNEKHYGELYQFGLECAFAALMSCGGTYYEQNHHDWIVYRMRQSKGYIADPMPYERLFAGMRYFLLERYLFEAWR